ncbi:MAG: ATP-binding protein [Bacteroidales bacterium]|nr:ATP-binding protein [Candidatus Latescibacterota bacterium]
MKKCRSVGELLADSGIPPKYKSCSLDSFRSGEKFVRFSRDFAEKLAAGGSGSVFLTGRCGSGKTHLAVGILKEAQNAGFSGRALFITTPEFVADLRGTISSNRSEKTVFDRLNRRQLVILDDLGAGKLSEYVAQSVFLLVDRCYREEIVTITTSNLSLEQIDQRIDPRIASRLSEGKIIRLDMPDFRRKRS